MSHRKEQGNILGYVLVGVVLAALVIGGIFVVRRYLPSSDTTNAPTQSDSTPTATTDAPTRPSTDENSDELKAALAQQAAEEKKAQEQKAANESKPATTSTTTASLTATTSASTTGTNAAALPATGPEDTLLSMAGVTLMTALVVAYVRSRALI